MENTPKKQPRFLSSQFFLLAVAVFIVFKAFSAQSATVPPDLNHKVRSQLLNEQNREQTIIFVTSWCPACRALEAALKKSGAEYTKVDIEESAAGEKLFIELSKIDGGQGIPLSLVGNELFRGFDPRIVTRSKSASPAVNAQKL